MSIEQKKKIDFIGFNETDNSIHLVISDHLDWDDPKGNHLLQLQDKINSYLAFIESGEIYKKYPSAQGKKIVIKVVGKFPLNLLADNFYHKARNMIRDAGFDLVFEEFNSEESEK